MDEQNLTFSTALLFLKEGKRVQRVGWNGKRMWLAMSPGVTDNPSEKFWSPAIREWATEAGVAAITVSPYIVMYTADKKIVPWLCSQTDMLAEDWRIV